MIESVKEWTGEFIHSPNMFFRVYLLVFAAGYLFFLTSNIWHEDMRKLVAATPLYQQQTYSGREVYISRWEYSPGQSRMEVELEIADKSLDDGNSCLFQAVEKTLGDLDTEILVDEKEYKVIRIYDIPKKWKQISLQMKVKKDDQEAAPLHLFTNVTTVEETENIPDLSQEEYSRQRMEHKLVFFASQIQSCTGRIEENQSAQKGYAEKIKELNEDMNWQTKKEQEETRKLISQAESEILNLNQNTQTVGQEIEEYREKIKKLAEKLQEQENGGN